MDDSNYTFWKKKRDQENNITDKSSEFADDSVLDNDKSDSIKTNKKQLTNRSLEFGKGNSDNAEKKSASYIWKDSKRDFYRINKISVHNLKTGRDREHITNSVRFPKGENDFVQIDAIIQIKKYDSNGNLIKEKNKIVKTIHSKSSYSVDDAYMDLSDKLTNIYGYANCDIELLGFRVFVFYENEFKIFDSKKEKSKKKSRK